MPKDVGVRSRAELRQFGAKLNQASSMLDGMFQHLGAQMQMALSGWDDDRARAFTAEFDRSKAEIRKISNEMQEFSSYISRFCNKLDDAYNTRIR